MQHNRDANWDHKKLLGEVVGGTCQFQSREHDKQISQIVCVIFLSYHLNHKKTNYTKSTPFVTEYSVTLYTKHLQWQRSTQLWHKPSVPTPFFLPLRPHNWAPNQPEPFPTTDLVFRKELFQQTCMRIINELWRQGKCSSRSGRKEYDFGQTKPTETKSEPRTEIKTKTKKQNKTIKDRNNEYEITFVSK